MSKPNNDIKGHETRSQIMKITSQRQTWAINRRPNKLLGRIIPLTEVTLLYGKSPQTPYGSFRKHNYKSTNKLKHNPVPLRMYADVIQQMVGV